MLKIINGKIYMRRGDDEVLEVALQEGAESTPAEIPADATLTLTVRQLPEDGSPVIFQSTSAPGSNRIIIRHADTAEAVYGEYSADVQMLTAENHRHTVWPDIDENDPPKARSANLKNFILLPEVTME